MYAIVTYMYAKVFSKKLCVGVQSLADFSSLAIIMVVIVGKLCIYNGRNRNVVLE